MRQPFDGFRFAKDARTNESSVVLRCPTCRARIPSAPLSRYTRRVGHAHAVPFLATLRRDQVHLARCEITMNPAGKLPRAAKMLEPNTGAQQKECRRPMHCQWLSINGCWPRSLPHCDASPTKIRIKGFLFLREHATLQQHARKLSTFFQTGYPSERPARSPKVLVIDPCRALHINIASLSATRGESRGSAIPAPIRRLR